MRGKRTPGLGDVVRRPHMGLMNSRLTTLERAFQLARSGECASIGQIKERLVSERYHDVAAQLYGPTLTASLRKLISAAPRPADGAPA